MKFCTKCGNQMADDMIFCQQCGTKDVAVNETENAENEQQDKCVNSHNASANFEQSTIKSPKLRTSMKVWMVISFVYAGIFAIGSITDISMFAGVCLFGVLGVMFLILAKTPKGSVRLFADMDFLKETQGISKGCFVGICIFLAMFMFVASINIFQPSTPSINETDNENVVAEGDKKQVSEPVIPAAFAEECPITVAVSMYDNIIGLPELSCNVKNKTDKEISAIQLYFLPKDVYGEEADGIFAQNKLQYDTPITAKGSDTIVWQMIDQSVKSGDLYVYSVYFSDGTEWGDRNSPISKIKKYALKMQVSY